MSPSAPEEETLGMMSQLTPLEKILASMPPCTRQEPTLTGMPAEVVHMIYGELPQISKLALSRTNRMLQTLSTTNLYRSAIINTRRPARARSFIKAAAKNGALVTELTIRVPAASCHVKECKKCNKRQTDSWKNPKIALALLRGDHDALLPNLRQLRINFPQNFGEHYPSVFGPLHYDSDDDDYDYDDFDDDEDEDEEDFDGGGRRGPAYPDEVYEWQTIHKRILARASDVFTALSKRTAGTIKHLTIQNLQMCEPRHVPSCATPGWRDFLGGLDKFDLHLWAGKQVKVESDFAKGWQQYFDGTDEYSNFIEAHLASLFFDHLSSVKHLGLECSLNAAVGSGAYDSRRLPLIGKNSPPNTMPLLESLQLTQIMAHQSLLDFVETRSGRTPLALTLKWTWAYLHEWDQREAHEGRWAEIFDGLRSLITREDGPRLSAFTMVPYRRGIRYRYAVIVGDDEEPHCWCCQPDDTVYLCPTGRDGPAEKAGNEDAEGRLLDAIALFNSQQGHGV